jgi:PIN domain nuclease of toxin-antitoxin system
MICAVVDTHALIWYLYNDARLSPTARTWIENAAASGDQVALSSITLAEMVYLIEKGRIDPTAMSRLSGRFGRPRPLAGEQDGDRGGW